jgi:NADH-quinone oxidoreductase subunit L
MSALVSTLVSASSEEAVEPITDVVTAADAGGLFPLMWLLVAIPAAGALILLLGGRRTNGWGHILGTVAVLVPFFVAIALLVEMMGKPEEERSVVLHLWDWVFAGNFTADMSLRLDPLSIVFVLLITGVGSLIHIYSIGYMAHDPDRRRFFGFLNLFIAAMLVLVLANNYLFLYVGWEGVGLASYLLIGFWQYKNSAAVAAKKAFVMNRVGDVGLSIAIMLMFVTFGSVAFEDVFNLAGEADSTVVTVIGLMLLLAATGKSAQYPLQAWLLDAMEGPTPVSALIHAATMVTAGVYLIVRSNAIFDLAPVALNVVLIVGVVTMVAGALIAMANDDIKKSLAGSTMSQIGYMFTAAGLGPAGYVFAIFHLLLHGMFKADLFLSAGSVMHGMNNQVDMRRFGALRAAMAVTTGTFIAGFLGIVGIPPFDSFFSKDHIIKAALSENWVAGMAALIAAGLTAFYMTRMLAMTFFGKKRWTEDVDPHESPGVMTVPMIILSAGALVGGLIMVYTLDIEAWLVPITGFAPAEPPIPEWALQLITLAIVAIGVVLAWRQYAMREVPETPPQDVSVLTVASRKGLYGDAINESLFMRPGQHLTRFLVWFDNKGVDGVVRGTAAGIGGLGERLKLLQNGFTRTYALTMTGGALLVLVIFILSRWAS